LHFIQPLTTLWLSSNQIGDKGAQYIGGALQKNTVRQKHLLHFSHIYLSHFPQTLTALHLDHNQIGDKGAQYLGEALQTNTVRQ
jgi:Ran GTPase-activating protein (RanGAP) involved in mRNA processing and transport